MTTPRYARPGELLAIDPRKVHQDRRGFFWMLGSGPVPNERRGDVAIVHVRGELEHHADAYYCESYEGIRRKWAEALSGEDAVAAHERAHRWDDDFQPLAATPPKALVMVIDSPGGVVSGLNETVRALQKMARESGVKTIAYCNEMAASAAYALACSCDQIFAPPSAIVGSIGVISTMVSQAKRDQKEGFDVRLITSGARKADGHLHAPISEKAVEVEARRVEKLADAFFGIVSKARRVPVGKIRNLEAGIFLGKDAKTRGLIDEVKSLDDVIAEAAAETTTQNASPASGGNQTDRRLKMNLSALIKSTEAAIAKEKDPEKLSALYATLAGYKKVEKHVEHTKMEEEDEEESESAAESEEKSEDGGDEKKAAAKSDDGGDDDEGDDDEGDDAKKAKASLVFRERVEALTGKRGKAALGALDALAESHAAMVRDVAALKTARLADAKANMIAKARAQGIMTPTEAKKLEQKDAKFVKGWIEMRRESGWSINTDESALVKPKHVEPGTEESLSPERVAAIEAAVAGCSGDKEKLRKALVAAHLEEHKKQLATALNGAGRY